MDKQKNGAASGHSAEKETEKAKRMLERRSIGLDEFKAAFGSEHRKVLRNLALDKFAGVSRRQVVKADGENCFFATGELKKVAPNKFILENAQTTANPGLEGLPEQISCNGKMSKGVMDGDQVVIFATKAPYGFEFAPCACLKRVRHECVMRVKQSHDGLRAVMDNRAESWEFPLPAGQALKAGDLYVGRFADRDLLGPYSKHAVVEMIGHEADKGIESKLQEYAHPSLCRWEQWAKGRPAEFELQDTSEREDRSDWKYVTIDGTSTRDFDDAIACAKIPGGWHLSVAIADVDAYVKKGSELDAMAKQQMTTVYLPHKTLPMFPEGLSNGECSLMEGQRRMALCADMEIGNDGEILSCSFKRAVIKSAKRLTYEQAQLIFDKDAQALVGLDAKTAASLADMSACAKALREQGQRNGRFDIGDAELGWKLGADGKIEKLYNTERLWSHKVVEESMLAANKSAAKALRASNLGGFFRNHVGLSAIDQEEFFQTAVDLGLAKEGQDLGRMDMMDVIDRAKRANVFGKMRSELLSRMAPAQYSEENEGHFSLASDEYCHFTSPIRRYPDLVTHRLIKASLDGAADVYKKADLDLKAERANEMSSLSARMENDARKLLLADFAARNKSRAEEVVVDVPQPNGFWANAKFDESYLPCFLPGKSLKLMGFELDRETQTWKCPNGAQVEEGMRFKIKGLDCDMASRKVNYEIDPVPLDSKPEEKAKAGPGI